MLLFIYHQEQVRNKTIVVKPSPAQKFMEAIPANKRFQLYYWQAVYVYLVPAHAALKPGRYPLELPGPLTGSGFPPGN
jgi:hypothetical protein